MAEPRTPGAGPLQIIGGEALADLGDLEAVVLEVFGRGDRPPGWFRRKLGRECVDPRLSAILREGGAIVGFFLVGRPPSRPGIARALGLGVLPRLRGRGLGRALIERAAARCAAVGLARLELLADPDRLGFYRRLGFTARERLATLQARARGRRSLAPPPDPYVVAGAAAVGGWLEEAWERTPTALRATHVVALAGGRGHVHLHVSREGTARLIHRVQVSPPPTIAADLDAAVIAGVTAALEQIAAPTPVLLFGVDPAGSLHPALVAAGWSTTQESVLVDREVRAVDRDPSDS